MVCYTSSVLLSYLVVFWILMSLWLLVLFLLSSLRESADAERAVGVATANGGAVSVSEPSTLNVVDRSAGPSAAQ